MLEEILAPPPKLLFRNKQVERARELVAARESFVVRGPLGVGKSTLLHMVKPLSATYVSCMSCRTYKCLRRRLRSAKLSLIHI